MEEYKNIFSDGSGSEQRAAFKTTVPEFTSTPAETKTVTEVIVKDNSEKLEEIEASLLSAINDASNEIPSSDMYGIVNDIKSDTNDIRSTFTETVEEIASLRLMIEDYVSASQTRECTMIEYITAINDNIKLASKIVVAEISLIIGIIVIFMFIGRFR